MTTRNASVTHREIPGQDGLPIVGETLAFLQATEAFVTERARRFGPVFRTNLFNKPTAVLVGAEANRFILSEGMTNLTWKDGWPPTFDVLLGEALFLQDGEVHRRKRNLLMPAFRTDALAGYTKVMHERLEASLARWEALGSFAWHPEFRRLTFEVASNLFLGADLGHDAARLTKLMDTWMAGLFAVPVDLPFTTFGKAVRARVHLRDFLERAVLARMKTPTRDALGLLVTSRDEEGRSLTMDELKSQALLLVAAGHDTTTSFLTSTAQLLAENPEVLERARAEQRDLGFEGPLGLEQLRQMSYLDNVLREVERLHPPAGFGFRGAAETFEFGGHTIPRGWQIVYSIEATHHDPRYFPDPLRFNPDRWAESARAETEHRSSFKLVGFGGGPRLCIGMTIAKTQIKIIFSKLLRDYDWQLEPGQDMRTKMIPSRRPASDLLVRFRRRARASA